jgi:hypothetical protein
MLILLMPLAKISWATFNRKVGEERRVSDHLRFDGDLRGCFGGGAVVGTGDQHVGLRTPNKTSYLLR